MGKSLSKQSTTIYHVKLPPSIYNNDITSIIVHRSNFHYILRRFLENLSQTRQQSSLVPFYSFSFFLWTLIYQCGRGKRMEIYSSSLNSAASQRGRHTKIYSMLGTWKQYHAIYIWGLNQDKCGKFHQDEEMRIDRTSLWAKFAISCKLSDT